MILIYSRPVPLKAQSTPLRHVLYPLKSMQDFFIHPTVGFDSDFYRSCYSTIFEDTAYTTTSMETTTTATFDLAEKTKRAAPTFETLPQETTLMQGYTSDEEAPSPIEADDLSIHSDDDSLSDVEIIEATHSSPPARIQAESSYNVPKSPCNQAQSVTIVPAGRAKVVSMPKLVKVNSAPTTTIARRRSSLKPPVSRLNQMELADYDVDEQSSSSSSDNKSSRRSSIDKSAPSTAPSSIAEREQTTEETKLSRRPSTPLLNAVVRKPLSLRPTTSRSTSSPISVGLFKDDPNSPLEYSPPTRKPTTPTTPKSKPSQPSFFNLSRFSKTLNRRNSTITPQHITAPPPPTPTTPTPSAAPSPRRPKSAGATRARMIARGASYRAPTLELPPCPDEVDGDFDPKARGGPVRKVSAPVGGL